MARGAALRSEAVALAAYAETLQWAVACFAENVVFRRSPFDPTVGGHGFSHGGVPFGLHDQHGTARVALAGRLHYRAVQVSTSPRGWEVQTVQYIYELHDLAVPPQEIVGYHWHPPVPDMPYAHVHAYAAPASTSRLHLPTGVVTLKDLFVLAMRDFGVSPLRDDWRAALDAADAMLRASLGWATTSLASSLSR